MANNLFADVPAACVAKSTVDFATAGFDSTNTRIIYEVGSPLKSYIPGRAINAVTSFTAGKGYYIVPKLDMDKSSVLAPPLPTGGLTQLNAPTGLTLGTATSTTQPLTWTDTNSSPNEVSYKIQVSPAGAGTWTDATVTGLSATGGTVTGLTASTAYDYRVIAVGDGSTTTDSNPSSTASGSTASGGGGSIISSAPWKQYTEADTGVTQSGGTISVVSDQVAANISGGISSYDLIQGTTGNQPAYVASALNSLPGINLAPNKSLTQRFSVSPINRPLVRGALVVFTSLNTSGSGAYGYVGYFSGGASRCDFGVENNGKPFMYSGALLIGPSALAINTPYWFWCEYLSGGTGNLYINDVLVVNGSTGSHTDYTGGGIGDAADTANAYVMIDGFIDSLPSSTVRTDVYNAVKAKYGF